MDHEKSTEERIKEAARIIFHEKGYEGARTRDIAEAAGINTALLNYYFRSKENLFNIIMMESIHDMFNFINEIINDRKTSLEKKIDLIVSKYIDQLLKSPHLPLFVLSEMQANPERLIKRSGAPHNLLSESYFFEQMAVQIDKESLKYEPLQIFINIVSMSIFPVVANPLIKFLYSMDEETYYSFIEERRTFVPQWIKQSLKLND